jgi:hypothetical protein
VVTSKNRCAYVALNSTAVTLDYSLIPVGSRVPKRELGREAKWCRPVTWGQVQEGGSNERRLRRATPLTNVVRSAGRSPHFVLCRCTASRSGGDGASIRASVRIAATRTTLTPSLDRGDWFTNAEAVERLHDPPPADRLASDCKTQLACCKKSTPSLGRRDTWSGRHGTFFSWH